MSSIDDSLLPPSAFIYPVSDSCKGFFNNFSNAYCQTEDIRSANKACVTHEAIISVEEMKIKMGRKKEKYNEKIHQQDLLHKTQITELLNEMEDVKKRFESLNKEKCELSDDLLKLKIYINGVENKDELLKDKHRLLNEVEELRDLCNEQQSIIESHRIQLSNVEKVLTIQERELEKEIVNSAGHLYNNKEVKFEKLLHTWRQKVLSLLVQQESDDVVHKRELGNLQQQLKMSEFEMDQMNSCLEQMHLKLETSNAEASSNALIVERLRREISLLTTHIQRLTNENYENEEAVYRLQRNVLEFKTNMETVFLMEMQKSSARMEIFQRRLDYASSRFPMIHAGFVRNKNMGNITVAEDDVRLSECNLSFRREDKILQLEEALIITKRELDNLRSERDRLIELLEKDSASFNDRINERKDELKAEMDELQSKTLSQEAVISKMSKELDIVQQENNRLKFDYDSMQSERFSEIEQLHSDLQEKRHELSTFSLEYSEFRRNALCEKNQLETIIKEKEKKNVEMETFWRKACDQLVAECNLLKMTMRQEGILSKIRERTTTIGGSTHQQAVAQMTSKKKDTDGLKREIEKLAQELREADDDC